MQEREYQDIDYSTINVDKTDPLEIELIKSKMKMKKKMHESLLAQGIKITLKSWISNLIKLVQNDCTKRF